MRKVRKADLGPERCATLNSREAAYQIEFSGDRVFIASERSRTSTSLRTLGPKPSVDSTEIPVLDGKINDLTHDQETGMPKSMPSIHENDTDLAYMVESWPSLPEHIRAAIRALIDAHQKHTPRKRSNSD